MEVSWIEMSWIQFDWLIAWLIDWWTNQDYPFEHITQGRLSGGGFVKNCHFHPDHWEPNSGSNSNFLWLGGDSLAALRACRQLAQACHVAGHVGLGVQAAGGWRSEDLKVENKNQGICQKKLLRKDSFCFKTFALWAVIISKIVAVFFVWSSFFACTGWLHPKLRIQAAIFHFWILWWTIYCINSSRSMCHHKS